MLFPLKTERVKTIITNKAFSRQKLIILTDPLLCGVLIQAAPPLFSYGRGTRISGSSLLYWVDKCVSWYLLLYIMPAAACKPAEANKGSSKLILDFSLK